MPSAPKRPCMHPGCPQLAPCSVHKPHTKPGHTYADRKSEPGRALYSTARWKRLRLRFLGKHPLCTACEKRDVLTLAAVVDHVIPHRGDERLFWDEGNWSALCASCHSTKTIGEVVNR